MIDNIIIMFYLQLFIVSCFTISKNVYKKLNHLNKVIWFNETLDTS